MQSFDVLSRALPLFGSKFLEASAGTGKTFAIEHLVIRLLLEGESPLTIDQILVVTFTRAATRELRLRIRSNFERILSDLETNRSAFDYVESIIEQGEDVSVSAKRRVQDALACFDDAPIFTIHGFCYQMLSEFAFESGLNFELSEPEQDGVHLAKMRELVFDFLRVEARLPVYSIRQIDAVIKKQQNDLEKVVDKLVGKMEKKEGFRHATFQDLYKQFLGAFSKIEEIDAAKFKEDFLRLSPHYKQMGKEETQVPVEQLSAWLEKKSLTEREFDALLGQKEWFLEKISKENLKVRAALPLPNTLNYPGLFEELRERLVPIWKEAKDPEQILERMAQDCRKRRERLMEDEEPFSPDEILKKMHLNAQNPAFAKAVRKKIEALIVDEFQDTDPIQWEIFQTLFLKADEPLRAFYLVGDPKQAIYAFRGADVYTYLDAQQTLGEKSRAYLSTNFRSEAPLVHALNRLFTSCGQAEWLKLPQVNKSLPFVSVNARKKEEIASLNDLRGSVHFLLAEVKAGREKSWPPISFEEEFLFPFVVGEIERLAVEEKLSLSRFALLVKDRYGAERLCRVLQERGISYSVKQKRKLNESAALIALEELLEAVIHFDDLTLARRVLAGPLFRELASHGAEETRRRFQNYFLQFSNEGFYSFFAEILNQQKELDFYRDLLQLTERLIEEEAFGLFSPQALLHFIRELKTGREDLFARGELAEEAVSILTTHMSKGLEFDVVFALGIASRHASDEEERGVLEEKEAEKMRQLYVALTRAKRRVYVPLLFDVAAKEIDLGSGAPIELFCKQLVSPFTLSTFVDHLDDLKKTSNIDYTLLERQKEKSPKVLFSSSLPEESSPPPLFIPSRLLLSFSSLSTARADGKKIETLSTEEKSPHTLPPGTETGTLLHQILENCFKTGVYRTLRKDEMSVLIAEETQNSLLSGWEEIIQEMLTSVLTLPLSPHTFCLKDILPHKLKTEMEFVFKVNDSLLKGFADLLFEWEGKYYLVDWKSNWLGGSNESYTEENLKQAMQEHDYFLQGAIYAAALERYVKLFDKRDFSTLFGGAFYVFLRGPALFFFRPDTRLCLQPKGAMVGKIISGLIEREGVQEIDS